MPHQIPCSPGLGSSSCPGRIPPRLRQPKRGPGSSRRHGRKGEQEGEMGQPSNGFRPGGSVFMAAGGEQSYDW